MINYQTIREQVANHLRSKILHLEILPGERVLEQEIADELGISRGPVRESLRQLEQEGLLEYRRNRGCIVRKFEKADAAEVFYLRAMMESAAIEHCRGEIPLQILEEMQLMLEQIRLACEAGDNALFFEQDELFHALLVKACGMPRLFVMWNSMSSIGFALFLTDKHQKFDVAWQYQRHVDIYDVLCTKNVEKAKETIRDHYLKTNALFLVEE